MKTNTREHIIRTYMELAAEKGPEKVSITNIVERCGITRKTFYYHFSDIFDLIETVMERKLEQLVAEGIAMPSLETGLVHFLRNLAKNRRLIERVADSPHYKVVLKMVRRKLGEYFYYLLDEWGVFDQIPKQEGEILVSVFTYTVMGIGLDGDGEEEKNLEKRVSQFLDLFKLDLRRKTERKE